MKSAELVICVLDGSGSMAGEKENQVKETMEQLIKRMAESTVTNSFFLAIIYFGEDFIIQKLDNKGDNRIIQFADLYNLIFGAEAQTDLKDKLLPLSTKSGVLSGQTNIALGLQQAFLLAREFLDPKGQISEREKLPNLRYVTTILLTDGAHNAAGYIPEEEADKLKNAQITLVTVGFGSGSSTYIDNLINMASHIKDQAIINKLKTACLDKFFRDPNKMCAYFPQINEESSQALRDLFHIASTLSTITDDESGEKFI
ncbi:MAG: VWA domain-containing protein [Candidatus Heimdallarchaeota archaeon]|nr:VWA domain-containing protein [Candidatus Heimdallarchaeota archaeon]